MCNNNQSDGNCIAELLNVILVLQQNACPCNGLDSCDRPMLGGGSTCLGCNTRPVMLYTCCPSGEPLSMPITKDSTVSCDPADQATCSSVFRIEKIEGNCATFRVLTSNPDTSSIQPWITTNSLFTIKLDCICIVRCLTDAYVEGVC